MPIYSSGGPLFPFWVTGTIQADLAAGTLSSPQFVTIVSGSDVVATPTNPLWVTGSVFVLNPSSGGAGGNVVAISGSIVGLSVGGVPLSNANALPISDAGASLTVDGSVAVSSVGGTVTVAAHAITSGSVTGLLIGGNAASNANPLPISDAGGSITVDGSVSITGTPNVAASQGAAASLGSPWPMILVSGSDPVGTTTHPFVVTGSVGIAAAVTVSNPQTTVTALSGSVTGLLVGGQAASNANPLPVGDGGGSITVDGTVSVSSVAGTVATSVVSGSVTGLLVGGQPVTMANPLPVTGSVFVLNPSGGTGGNVTSQSGSVTGLLVGGVNVANANPLPISDAGGSITVDGAVSISGTPSVSAAQGTAASLGAPWPMILVSGSDPVGTTTHPLVVTGSIGLAAAVTVSNPQTTVTTLSGSIVAVGVGGVPLSNANPIPISDAGGSLTVDGSVSITGTPTINASQGTAAAIGAPWPVLLVSGSDAVGTNTHPMWVTGSVFVLNQSSGGPSSNVTAVSGSVTGLLVGGVEVSNANGIPITDGGGSITVDGTVSVGSPNVTALSGSVTGLLVGGVSVSNANVLPIGDGGGSITVDGTVSVNAHAITSGSLTGLLVGGVAVSNANGMPITDAGGSVTVDGSVTVSSATVISGSVTGLLLGGQPASNANPIPISDAGGSITVDGTVAISGTPNVTAVSGSVTGLLVGGVAVSNANPTPISDAGGSITVDGTVSVNAHAITSGSLTGLLVGGVAVSNANGVPITDAGGSLTVDGSVSITGTPSVTAAQGTAAAIGAPWPVLLVSGSDPVGTTTHPMWVTGSVFVLNPSSASGGNVTAVSGSVTGLLVGGAALSNANPIPIGDAGGSITVDGSVAVSSATVASGSVIGLLVGGQPAASTNPVPTRERQATSAAGTNLTASVTSQLLVNTSSTRLGLTIYNDSPATMYLKFGGAAASNDFSFKLFADDYYEVPYGHTGRIDVIWTTATGSARITEFT